jgi:MoaA/NifB/PqqE/SkfB family radical SAM enzyme
MILVPARTNGNYCYAAWRITYRCNFRCTYCTSGREPSPEAPGGLRNDLHEQLPTVIDNLKATGKDWTLAFTGGEPMVYPRFIDICREMGRHFKLYLDTNLSLPIDGLLEAAGPDRFEHVYAAMHIMDRMQSGTLDVFVHNVQLLAQGGYPFTINYVMYPPLIEQFDKHRALFEKLGIPLTPKSFKGVFQGRRYPQSYTDAQRELIHRYSPGDTYTRSIPDYHGLRCNAGCKLVRVLEDGSVTRCVTDNRSMGNVFTGITLDDEPQPCQVNRCPCYGPARLFEGVQQDDSCDPSRLAEAQSIEA